MFRRFMNNRLTRSDSNDSADVDSQSYTSSGAASSSGGGFTSAIKNLPSSLSSLGPSPSSAAAAAYKASSTSFFGGEKYKQKIQENVQKVQELASFDACLEASDALAASSTSSGRIDPISGLADCSVLISPDGDLLLIPQEQQTKEALTNSSHHHHHSTTGTTPTTTTTTGGSTPTTTTRDSTELRDTSSLYVKSVKELLQTNPEFESAIFRGTDLLPAGDKALNGFSAQGWSIPAASLAMKQNEHAMSDLAEFTEDLIIMKKNNAIREYQLVRDKLKILLPHPQQHSTTTTITTNNTTNNGGKDEITTTRIKEYQTFLQTTFPPEQSPIVDIVPKRVGPLSFDGGTIHATVVALEQYYTSVANADSKLWDKATQQQSGVFNKLRKATSLAETRNLNRQQAIQQMLTRAMAMEEHLKACKIEAAKRWDAVHDAEEHVTKLVEEKMLERSRLKEQQRLEQMKQDEARRAADAANGNFGATSNEIWDIVSAVAASMEEGSFEPMDLPQAPLSVPRDQSSSRGGGNNNNNNNKKDESSSSSSAVAAEDDSQWTMPVTSRHELEEKSGLPDLRVAALAADEAVDDAGKALLTVLSNMDTTKRSARIAAESGLVSACNAQASCLRSLIAMERKSVEERLARLTELEHVADSIDVRADMNNYITQDKKEPGGRGMLGDDDDGGIASALDVLSRHVDGDIMGFGSPRRSSSTRWDDDDSTSPELLEEGVNELFKDNPLLRSNAPEDEEATVTARKEFEAKVDMLCKTGKDKSSAARSRRSNITYALNARRSRHSRIRTSIQFDGLCRLFAALLAGCDCEGSGVSIAKMCMMLSQTFYLDKSIATAGDNNSVDQEDDNDDSRENRVYAKSCLVDHPLWENDTFWDNALYQCVSESLTHSGVMSNFEETSTRVMSSSEKQKSEWTETHKMRWHDLNEHERVEAASQVHAVVFAQLGALGHSMIEFGCGLERSSAFVRRMAVRNQLPASQRTMLLQHLLLRDVDSGEEGANVPIQPATSTR